jgi:thiamine biosynthesis protein ThiS
MNIRINGNSREIADHIKLSDLLRGLQIRSEGIAVELNREVLPRERWNSVVVQEGDALEIVQFVGGGK